MEKKEWVVPEVVRLDIEDTQHGKWIAIGEFEIWKGARLISYSPSGTLPWID